MSFAARNKAFRTHYHEAQKVRVIASKQLKLDALEKIKTGIKQVKVSIAADPLSPKATKFIRLIKRYERKTVKSSVYELENAVSRFAQSMKALGVEPSFATTTKMARLPMPVRKPIKPAQTTRRAETAKRHKVTNLDGVAVIIGNQNYTHGRVSKVAYARRDAAAFKHYVTGVLGYDSANIIDLPDATQAQMMSAFGNNNTHQGKLWRYLNTKRGSDVVVFYSGHGVPGQRSRRGYLLPVNADPDAAEINGYPIDLLYTNLGKLKEAKSIRVFLDACFSGDSHSGMLIRNASPVFIKAVLPKTAKKMTVLTAASGSQLASWDEKAKHGLFTHHLLDALYGRADANTDGRVTAAETKKYLDRYMTRAARRTYGRHQTATLTGAAASILAVRAGKRFPQRPATLPP